MNTDELISILKNSIKIQCEELGDNYFASDDEFADRVKTIGEYKKALEVVEIVIERIEAIKRFR